MTFENDGAGAACDGVGTRENERGMAGEDAESGGGASGTDGEASQYPIEDGQAPSEAVIRAVAARSACDAGAESGKPDLTELDPLYEAIEPDALDALFAPLGDRRAAGAVSFTYCGYRVTVESEESVTVAAR